MPDTRYAFFSFPIRRICPIADSSPKYFRASRSDSTTSSGEIMTVDGLPARNRYENIRKNVLST